MKDDRLWRVAGPALLLLIFFYKPMSQLVQFFHGKITFDQLINNVTPTVSNLTKPIQAYLPFGLDTLADLCWIGVGIVSLALIIHWGNAWRLRKKAERQLEWIRILPSRATSFDKGKVQNLINLFGQMGRRRYRWFKGDVWFRLRLAQPFGSKEIGIYLGYPAEKENSVMDAIRTTYPHAEIFPIRKAEVPFPNQHGKGGHFIFKGKSALPLSSIKDKKHSSIGNILTTFRPGSFLELQFSPSGWGELEDRVDDTVDKLKHKKVNDLSSREKARKLSITKRLTGRENSFTVRLSLWSNSPQAGSVIHSTSNAIKAELKHDGELLFYQHIWQMMKERCPVPFNIPYTLMTWTGDELANLFHLPPGNHEIYTEPKKGERGYLPALEVNQKTLDDWELSKGAFIGQLKHPIMKREVRIDFEQFSKHFVLTGAPGMGKSSLLVEMMDHWIQGWLEDPDNHPGFTFIDPAEEGIATIENRLRYYEQVKGITIPRHKIRHFDLTPETTHSVAMNLLHKPKGVSASQVAQNAAEVILGTTGSSSSLTQSKRLLQMALQALLEDEQPHTILGIEEMFRNPAFRAKVLMHVKDPYVKRQWDAVPDDEDLGTHIGAILNRLDPLLSDQTMRRLFCQPKMNLDIRKYMDDGCLVLININNMTKNQVRIVGNHLVNQYYYTAKQRPPSSKLHMLMVDEAHLLDEVGGVIAKSIAETRKRGLGIGFITQDLDQIKNKELIVAFRLVGTIMSCAQGDGASKIEDMTDGVFTESFIRQLPERNCAIFTRSKRDGRSHITTCMVENAPPVTYLPDGEIAPFHNKKALAYASEWGLSWGKALMAEQKEVEHVDTVDAWIEQYMNPPKEVHEPKTIEESHGEQEEPIRPLI